jgi:hypothetical protein
MGPMEDTHTMVFSMGYNKRTQALRKLKDCKPIPGLELDAGLGSCSAKLLLYRQKY